MAAPPLPPRGRWLLALALALVLAVGPAAAQEAPTPVVIAHPSVPRLDALTLRRLYTGRAIEVAGQPVTVVQLQRGQALRQRFLSLVLGQDEEHYQAYWTVRRHIGKGAPPPELAGPAQVIEFVRQTPGAIGYVDAADLQPGLNVVLRP